MTRSEVLTEARKCVCGGRDDDYGKPEDNFRVISNLWSEYIGVEITGKDVAVMMILLKIARLENGGSEDCWVDIAGYAACGGEIDTCTNNGNLCGTCKHNSVYTLESCEFCYDGESYEPAESK